MSFSIIAAIGRNRELGSKGGLIWRLPEDTKFFRRKTMGHMVVMGRKTRDSLPPAGLVGREMIVLSRSYLTFDDFMKTAPKDREVFVIGGGSIYEQFLPYADTLYLTEVDATSDKADVFFPEVDYSKYDREVLGAGACEGISYTFVKYTKKKEEK
ncbi:dihydrofolate reductase [Candidatus Saccharibacteria bacterium]|nr:dihydrofolate reductase [Candidatus Saccharibacteria bacterium]